MKIQAAKTIPASAALVIAIAQGERIEGHPFFKLLRGEDARYLRGAAQRKEGLGEGVTKFFLPSGKIMLVIGAGEKEKFSHRKAILLMRKMIFEAKKERLPKIAVHLADFASLGMRDEEIFAELFATQAELANFEFNAYKTKPKEGWSFVTDVSVSHDGQKSVSASLRRGKIVGEEINAARTLSNTPGGDMTPVRLAEAAVKTGKRCGFRVKILDEKAIRRFKMGGVFGVAKGSSKKPRFIIMEYQKGKRGEKPIVLVGKGVTFDTGGLNLKPEQGITEMHMDMSGGAAVIHAIAALARLNVKKNIVGLVPAVENMPSGSSYHPGDVLYTMSGKTIEVLNTDAEGRVILADALTYAKKYDPRLVIDVATLTGAACVALGQRASAIFTTEPRLEKTLRETGEAVGDFVWPLPLWEEYEDEIKGTLGDVANIGKTKYGGAITGAVFLWQFIKDSPSTGSGRTASPPAWVHIDIAPRMTTIEGEHLAKGAAGAPIALLTKFLENF